MPRHGTPGWFLFLRESTGAQLGAGWQPLAALMLLLARLCWVSAIQDPGCSPGCSSQPCPFPVASCCSSTPAGLSWAACSQTAEAVTSLVPSTKLAVTCSRHCPGPLPSCARGDAEPAACWALLCEDLLPPWGERGQASSSCRSPSPVEPCCCLSAPLGHPAGPTPVCCWLSWREGHQCVLNCLKVIKGSWVDILNRTFVASVNL